MTTDEAIKIIQRQAPCGHHSTENIGDGVTWAQCNDCGATFRQSNLGRARESAQRFDDAVEHLRAAAAMATAPEKTQ